MFFSGCTIALLSLAPPRSLTQGSPTPSRIPGTAVELVPPVGFTVSPLFSGFENPQTGASIIVMEMPVPQSDAQRFLRDLANPEILQSRGMTLKTTEAITLGGHGGKLLFVSQTAAGTAYLKWIAVTVVGDRALLVNAPFPASQAATLQEPLRQSILRLRWTPNLSHQLLEGLPFTFQPAGDLQPSFRVLNMVTLSRQGAKPPIPPSQPLLMIGVAYQRARIRDIATFARERLKTLSDIKALTQLQESPKTIAGHPAFEITGHSRDVKTNAPLFFYQTILTTDQTYYFLEGRVAQTEETVYLPLFRAVAESLVPQH